MIPGNVQHTRPRTTGIGALLIGLLFAACAGGCRSLPPMAPVDPSQPGWSTYRGQAVWQPPGDRAEMAGELYLALHSDGRGLVEFSKPLFPMVAVQHGKGTWRITYGANHRTFGGKGTPSSRHLWLRINASVRRHLTGNDPNESIRLTLSHPRSGETIEIVLPPPAASAP